MKRGCANFDTAPWEVIANFDKKRRFVLYARGAAEAVEIATDYIEQTVKGPFELVGVKNFHDCTALTDNFRRHGIEGDDSVEAETDAPVDNDARFYLVELSVHDNVADVSYPQKFLCFTSDAEKAKQMAVDWIINRRREQLAGTNPAAALRLEIEAVILSAAPVNCYGVIPPEFSKEYFDHDPNGSTCN